MTSLPERDLGSFSYNLTLSWYSMYVILEYLDGLLKYLSKFEGFKPEGSLVFLISRKLSTLKSRSNVVTDGLSLTMRNSNKFQEALTAPITLLRI